MLAYGVKRATVSDGMPLGGPRLACSTPQYIHYVTVDRTAILGIRNGRCVGIFVVSNRALDSIREYFV